MWKNIKSIKDKWLIKGEHLRLSPHDILLDSENPRFWSWVNYDQEDIIANIVKKFWVNDLLFSISNNGYFDEEPIVVIPGDNWKYIVLEWNRRIATIKILLDPEKYEKVLWNHKIRLTIPRIQESIEKDILKIPVIKYQTRDDVLVYLWVKHITGVEPWSAYAKWAYVTKLIEEYSTSIDVIWDIIWDSKKTIWQTYIAYKVLEQFKEYNPEVDGQEIYEKIEKNFSYLQLLVNNWILKNYIWLKSIKDIEDINRPIPDDKIKNLNDMFGWLFWVWGEKVIQESREIGKLSHVIAKDLSLNILKEKNDLLEAYDYSDGEIEALNRKLASIEKGAADLRSALIKLNSNDKESFMINLETYRKRLGLIKDLIIDSADYLNKNFN